jgi:hypothetical protein
VLRAGYRIENCVELRPPALGARRVPGPRLRARQRHCVELVDTAAELKKHAQPGSFVAAAALADAVIALISDLVGHDLRDRRTRFSTAAHFGGLLATAEEAGGYAVSGLTEVHVDAVLAAVQAQFRDPDPLGEQLSGWMLEAGYFLVRTGCAPQILLAGLRAELLNLLDGLDEESLEPTRRHLVPRPAARPDREMLGALHR